MPDNDARELNKIPYRDNKKKFIGGAEAARRKARKLPRATKPKIEKKCKVQKSRKHNLSEFFFSSLLKTNLEDLLYSNEDRVLRSKVIHEILTRVGLPFLSKLPSSYHDAKQFYFMKASLLLEEARCHISQALINDRRKITKSKGISMNLLSSEMHKNNEYITLVMEKMRQSHDNKSYPSSVTYFTPQELYDTKPGCLLELSFVSYHGCKLDVNEIPNVLVFIKPTFNFGKSSCPPQNAQLKLILCNTGGIPDNLFNEGSKWLLKPVTTLINCLRQFEGCMRCVSVPFMPKLLGWSESTHIRFDSDGEENVQKSDSFFMENSKEHSMIREIVSNKFPKLNQTQERAASSFISSPPSTLTIVQGPPGTGKTTFLVSLIYRNLLKDPSSPEWSHSNVFNLRRRMMVTAPTNRALTVITTRFLDAIDLRCPLNLVMIGVEEKLMDETGNNDPFSVDSLSPSLRSIYVYTWLENVINSYLEIGNQIINGLDSGGKFESVYYRACLLKVRLERGIPSLYRESRASGPCDELLLALSNMIEISKTFGSEIDSSLNVKQTCTRIHDVVNSVVSCLNIIDPNSAIKELLATANVIFCTLSTAGTSFIKQTPGIEDLFVDEAAAASETEISIPFHLLPSRMLIVGDPNQLPVTILSKEAEGCGLGKSLHERLMYDCGKDYIMLDVQYRMRPEISSFPSHQFYGGKISNGENVTGLDYKGLTETVGGAPFSFINVVDKEQRSYTGSYFNVKEANTVVALVKSIVNTSPTVDWGATERLRIITFYQGQVNYIRDLLRRHKLGQINVATVDSSQGSEAEIVIISFVRSSDRVGNAQNTTAGFLADDRRLNVALTRAKYQLICAGNTRSLANSGVPSLKSLIDNALERGCIQDFASSHEE